MSSAASSAENAVRLREARRAICHPDPRSPLCSRVIEELERLGVEAYLPLGPRRLPGGYRLLGRGWAGNVFAALWRGEVVAVKVTAPDSRRHSMLRECLLASIASAVGVAPRIYACSRYAMVMRLVRGPRLSEYKPGARWEAYLVLRRLLYKAYLLDRLGIDHGELTRPGGQVLVEDAEPYIIDYDSASAARKPRNLTRLVAGLSRIDWVRGVARPSTDPAVREALRSYRAEPSLEKLEEVIRAVLGWG